VSLPEENSIELDGLIEIAQDVGVNEYGSHTRNWSFDHKQIVEFSRRVVQRFQKPYHYIGRDGKTVTAAELEDRIVQLEKELQDERNKSN
jgi:hypothetical protein